MIPGPDSWLNFPTLCSSELERLATLQQILETRNGAGSHLDINAVNGALEVGEVTQDDFKAKT